MGGGNTVDKTVFSAEHTIKNNNPAVLLQLGALVASGLLLAVFRVPSSWSYLVRLKNNLEICETIKLSNM